MTEASSARLHSQGQDTRTLEMSPAGSGKTCVFLLLLRDTASAPQGNPRGTFLLDLANSGKTTTLKAISNLLRAERGDVTKGTIEFMGRRVDRLTPNELVRMGVCQVMEGRHCFPHLTIEETS